MRPTGVCRVLLISAGLSKHLLRSTWVWRVLLGSAVVCRGFQVCQSLQGSAKVCRGLLRSSGVC